MNDDLKLQTYERIANIDLMIVICGYHTNEALWISEELVMARNLGIRLMFLRVEELPDLSYRYERPCSICTYPKTILETDLIYEWTWDNLKKWTKEKEPRQ